MTPGQPAAFAEFEASISAETIEDLYDRAPCGYLTMRPDGTIARVNQTFLTWTGFSQDELVGRLRFVDLLSVGGRIYHETHYFPLLLMQDEVREISFELRCPDGQTLPTLVNSLLVRDPSGEVTAIRTTVFDVTLRREYELELLRARQRAEESEVQVREVARLLQVSLLQGSVAAGPGFTVETRYRPAVETLEVGGDWHDAFLLSDGVTLGVSVGDVVGRGIVAACAMGQIRSALRALAGSGIGPSRLLEELDRFVDRVPDAHCATVAYAEINLASGAVRYACAGHPPPLLVHASGETELLWDGRSTPLGAIDSGGPRPDAETFVDDHSRLVLYTDGLIERRTRSIDVGLEHLAQTASRLARSALGDISDGLMAEMLRDEDTRDDVCLLSFGFAPGRPNVTDLAVVADLGPGVSLMPLMPPVPDATDVPDPE